MGSQYSGWYIFFSRPSFLKSVLNPPPLPSPSPSPPIGKPSKPKDANDALRTGWDLKKIIEGAEHIPNSKIATLRDYKSFILRELQDPLATGFAFFGLFFFFEGC